MNTDELMELIDQYSEAHRRLAGSYERDAPSRWTEFEERAIELKARIEVAVRELEQSRQDAPRIPTVEDWESTE